MGNKVAIVPHNEMGLPQKLCQGFSPLFSSTNSSIGILPIVNLRGNIWSTKIKNVLRWNSSCKSVMSQLKGNTVCSHMSTHVNKGEKRKKRNTPVWVSPFPMASFSYKDSKYFDYPRSYLGSASFHMTQ